MEEFKKELKELLEKHNGYIYVEKEQEFMSLGIGLNAKSSDFVDMKEDIDTGHKDLYITA
jgi:hypothetical protein